jgi:hypothetical protein
MALLDAPCVDHCGAFGKDTLRFVQWIADAVLGERPVAERSLFKGKSAEHIGGYMARSVLEAHDVLARGRRHLTLEVQLALYGRGGPSDVCLEAARWRLADRRGPHSRSQARPRVRSARYGPHGRNGYRFVGGGVLRDSRNHSLSCGELDDSP